MDKKIPLDTDPLDNISLENCPWTIVATPYSVNFICPSVKDNSVYIWYFRGIFAPKIEGHHNS